MQTRLAGTTGNRSAIGARVAVTTRKGTETVIQIRESVSHTGFRGQSAMTAHFGLGEASEDASLEVRWPSGQRSSETDIMVDRPTEIIESQVCQSPVRECGRTLAASASTWPSCVSRVCRDS